MVCSIRIPHKIPPAEPRQPLTGPVPVRSTAAPPARPARPAPPMPHVVFARLTEKETGKPIGAARYEVRNGAGKKVAEGKCRLDGSTIEAKAPGRVLLIGSAVDAEASKVTLAAGQVDLNASMVKASNEIDCQTIKAASVIGSSYTPGAGNVW